MKIALSLPVALILAVSIAYGTNQPDAREPQPAPVMVASSRDKETEVIIAVLLQLPKRTRAENYYLTATPIKDWGKNGEWKDMLAVVYETLSFNQSYYYKASEAKLEKGAVKDKTTGAAGWIAWIVIKEWISDTEVRVVECGYRHPLASHANTAVYHKVEGKWELKNMESMVVS
jgi:hypothetical protein